MTFWDFANQHPFITIIGLYFVCSMVESAISAVMRPKGEPGFKALDNRLRALEPCPSGRAGKFHVWVPSEDPRVVKCQHCGITRRA